MISVIVPIYNAEKSLGQLFSCIQKQTFIDYEVILVDDGSTDSSGKICDNISLSDNRFKAYHQVNSGVSVARNKGIELSSGKYITFLDADDKIDTNYLSVLFDSCVENGVDISICNVSVIQSETEVKRFTMQPQILNSIDALNELFIRKNINSGPCAKLFKRTVIENIRFPLLNTYEDILFVKEAFSHAKKIFVTNMTSYYYIQNIEGAMNQMLRFPSMDVVYASQEILDFISRHQELADECLYVTVSHLMQYMNIVINLNGFERDDFIDKTIEIYKKYRKEIIMNTAFPWKEKITYILLSYGLLLKNRRIEKYRNGGRTK